MKRNIFLKRLLFSVRSILIGLLITFLLVACSSQPAEKDDSQVTISDNPDHLDWFKEAKFGMFIHWGPYSNLAGEWNGKQVKVGENAEWVMKKLEVPVNEYRELAHNFNPLKFDALAWVRMAKAAGMKYIVITAKHHDGFAMYNSEVSSYNITQWTPFKRDPLKELSEACAAEGIKFCVYYSHREDWDHPGGYGNNWDYDNDWGDDFYDSKEFNTYLEEKAKPQLRELLSNYGPIGLVWFDRGMYTPEQGKEFVDLVHGIQPATLINGRVGHYDQEFLGDYQSMGDNGMPPGGVEEYWETPMTLNKTWGFSKFDTLWKSPEIVIQRLVEIVSRGGNYLLNIGPKGDGEIPEATINIFSNVGSWVTRNGEALYGTTANPFGELEWGYSTVKGNRVYLFIRDWPANGEISLTGFNNTVKRAFLLTDSLKNISVKKLNEVTNIKLPSNPSDYPISVLVLETDLLPSVNPAVVIQKDDGELLLNYLTAVTNGKAMTRFNRKGGFHISKWLGPEDSVEWIVNVNKPGRYKVKIDYSANAEWTSKPYEIIIADKKLENNVVFTGGWYEYHEFTLGYVDFQNPGNYKVLIRPSQEDKTYLMYLRSLILSPVQTTGESGWGTN